MLGDVTVRIIGFEQLGVDDQDVLLGLLALAGKDGRVLSPAPTKVHNQALVGALCPQGEATKQNRLVITTSLYRLAQTIGTGLHATSTYKRLRASLTRLANVQCIVSCPGTHGQENLLAWLLQEDGTVKIAINSRLAQAVMGDIHYVSISLIERRALRSDPARILHSRLSAMIRPGASWTYHLNALAAMVWGDEANPATLRRRRHRIKNALLDLQLLPGWSIKIDQSMVTIVRPVLVSQ